MRRRMGIGVVFAVLLFGLIAPGVAGASGSDRLVAAGPAHGVDDLVKAFRTITEALRRSPVERGAIAVADRLDAFIPRVVRTPWGELELGPQHR